MLSTKKPNRCKHCRERMPEDKARHVLHEECKDAWIAKQLEKQAAARLKKQRAQAKLQKAVDRKKREAQKTIPQLIKEAQHAFNGFVRQRDQHQSCICCGRPLGSTDVGGGFDCGHYRSVGSASHLRFNEFNAHGQTKACNRYGAGRAVDYRIGLVARIGLAEVEALEASNTPHKWTRDELIAIRATYIAKRKALNASPVGQQGEQ